MSLLDEASSYKSNFISPAAASVKLASLSMLLVSCPAVQGSLIINYILKKVYFGKNHAANIQFHLYDGARSTEHNCTTFVTKGTILMEWDTFFFHHNNIWKIIRFLHDGWCCLSSPPYNESRTYCHTIYIRYQSYEKPTGSLHPIVLPSFIIINRHKMDCKLSLYELARDIFTFLLVSNYVLDRRYSLLWNSSLAWVVCHMNISIYCCVYFEWMEKWMDRMNIRTKERRNKCECQSVSQSVSQTVSQSVSQSVSEEAAARTN